MDNIDNNLNLSKPLEKDKDEKYKAV